METREWGDGGRKGKDAGTDGRLSAFPKPESVPPLQTEQPAYFDVICSAKDPEPAV